MKQIFLTIFLFVCLGLAHAGRPQIVAHRGYHRADGSAENSIRALVKADSIGAEQCEFDVWISADDVLYVNHNADIQGVIIETSKSKDIDKCTLKNGERVPRLETFLDTATTLGIGLVLEIKPHKNAQRENVAVPKIIEMIERKGLKDRTIYITFSENACKLLVEKAERPVYYLTGVSPDKIEELGATGPDFHISHFRKNPDWIKEFQAQGKPVNIWTVDSENDIKYCIAQGADFITTNEPELAQKLVNDAFAPVPLTIMSYNLRFGELATMERLAEEIKAQKPDFVALQEVDVNSMRTMAPHNNGVNFINELAELTGMFGYFGKTLNFSVEGGYYGIGILSRYPAESIEALPLPNPKNEEPRIMLKGVFRLKYDLPFVFASTHFDFKSPETQLLQAEYVLRNLKQCKLPVIIGGDFNCEQNSKALQVLADSCITLSGTAPTFPAKKPEKRLDHIFGYPKNFFKFVKTYEGPSGENTASDHIPVISVVEMLRQ